MKTKAKSKKIKERKKGISLITLVITIVVIIILAAAVILTLNNNNPVGSASDAVRQQDRANVQDKVTIVLASIQTKYLCSVEVTPGNINEGIEYKLINPQNANGVTGGIVGWNETKAEETGKDNSFTLEIERPTYKQESTTWYIDEQGRVTLTVGDETYGDDITQTPEEENLGEGTRVLEEATYNKPYVPDEFSYIEGTVDEGYVVADSIGNEFVWVPVDGVNVKYERWCKDGISYDDINLNLQENEETTIISNIINDMGGFYIGRYEIGVPDVTSEIGYNIGYNIDTIVEVPLTTTPSIKKGKEIYTLDNVSDNINTVYISQNDAKSTTLLGTAYDTTMRWLKQSGYNVEGDSSLYGNYSDGSGNGSLKLSGSNENWKMNNIYDLAGNIAELTIDEIYVNKDNNVRLKAVEYIVRGGSYKDKGNEVSVSSRNKVSQDNVSDVGTRLLVVVGNMEEYM